MVQFASHVKVKERNQEIGRRPDRIFQLTAQWGLIERTLTFTFLLPQQFNGSKWSRQFFLPKERFKEEIMLPWASLKTRFSLRKKAFAHSLRGSPRTNEFRRRLMSSFTWSYLPSKESLFLSHPNSLDPASFYYQWNYPPRFVGKKAQQVGGIPITICFLPRGPPFLFQKLGETAQKESYETWTLLFKEEEGGSRLKGEARQALFILQGLAGPILSVGGPKNLRRSGTSEDGELQQLREEGKRLRIEFQDRRNFHSAYAMSKP